LNEKQLKAGDSLDSSIFGLDRRLLPFLASARERREVFDEDETLLEDFWSDEPNASYSSVGCDTRLRFDGEESDRMVEQEGETSSESFDAKEREKRAASLSTGPLVPPRLSS
jgi:hypothetical protein